MSGRAFISLLFLVAVTSPLLLFSAAFWPTLRGHLDADIAVNSRALLAAVSSQVATAVFERPRSVLPTVLMLADSAAIPPGRLLGAFGAARSEYAALLLVDAEGRVEAAYGDAARTADRRYVPRARPVPGGIAVSTPFIEGGRPLIEVSYGNPRRMVVGLVDLQAVSSRLVLATRSPLDRIGVVDAEGRFILCSDPSRLARDAVLDARAVRAADLVRVEDSGIPFYSLSTSIPGSDWSAVYLSAVSAAEGPLRSFLWRLAAVIAASLAGFAVIAFVLWKILTQPLAQLVLRIEKIAAGRYDERVSGEQLPEFREIGAAFNAMAESIQRRDREIKRREERMAAALEEKTLLLKEIYHRVKNNLQIIASLLNMQANGSSDEAVASALRDGQDRVYAMSLVHELVYQMADLSSIDAADYVSRLAMHAADAHRICRDRIELKIERFCLGLERAIPFGLALNEILSNAFKYAAGEGGPVRLSLRVEDGIAELRVEDAGPGMPPGVLDAERSSLGISLIEALATQLHGRAAWGPGLGGRGVGVAFRFPLAGVQGSAKP